MLFNTLLYLELIILQLKKFVFIFIWRMYRISSIFI